MLYLANTLDHAVMANTKANHNLNYTYLNFFKSKLNEKIKILGKFNIFRQLFYY